MLILSSHIFILKYYSCILKIYALSTLNAEHTLAATLLITLPVHFCNRYFDTRFWPLLYYSLVLGHASQEFTVGITFCSQLVITPYFANVFPAQPVCFLYGNAPNALSHYCAQRGTFKPQPHPFSRTPPRCPRTRVARRRRVGTLRTAKHLSLSTRT